MYARGVDDEPPEGVPDPGPYATYDMSTMCPITVARLTTIGRGSRPASSQAGDPVATPLPD